MFAPTQLLRNWRKQRPSNSGEYESGEGWENLLHGRAGVSDLIFAPQYKIVLELRFKWHILYKIKYWRYIVRHTNNKELN